MSSSELTTPKFIKLTDVWSDTFYVNVNDINFMTRSKTTGLEGRQAATYLLYCHANGANVVETIEEIIEIIKGN